MILKKDDLRKIAKEAMRVAISGHYDLAKENRWAATEQVLASMVGPVANAIVTASFQFDDVRKVLLDK